MKSPWRLIKTGLPAGVGSRQTNMAQTRGRLSGPARFHRVLRTLSNRQTELRLASRETGLVDVGSNQQRSTCPDPGEFPLSVDWQADPLMVSLTCKCDVTTPVQRIMGHKSKMVRMVQNVTGCSGTPDDSGVLDCGGMQPSYWLLPSLHLLVVVLLE